MARAWQVRLTFASAGLIRSSLPSSSRAFCNGYDTGAGTKQLLDTHCDRKGFPKCFTLGKAAGNSTSPGTPCPSGHSLNFCSGWQIGNGRGDPPSTTSVEDASYDVTQNNELTVALIEKDDGQDLPR